MRDFFIVTTTAIALISSAPARALNFDFSFTNTIGNVSGTVTGEIFGLADNTTGEAATDVVIDSAPIALSEPAMPWDIFNAAGYTVLLNSFTVSGEEITAANFEETDGSSANFFLDNANLNELVTLGHGDGTLGFAGATYTLDSTDVPEPSSIALLLTGLVGFKLIRRRRFG